MIVRNHFVFKLRRYGDFVSCGFYSDEHFFIGLVFKTKFNAFIFHLSRHFNNSVYKLLTASYDKH